MTNKISLLQGQKERKGKESTQSLRMKGRAFAEEMRIIKGTKSIVTSLLSDLVMANRNAAISSHPMESIPGYPGAFVKTGLRNAF